jgi:hypothetical protein
MNSPRPLVWRNAITTLLLAASLAMIALSTTDRFRMRLAGVPAVVHHTIKKSFGQPPI